MAVAELVWPFVSNGFLRLLEVAMDIYLALATIRGRAPIRRELVPRLAGANSLSINPQHHVQPRCGTGVFDPQLDTRVFFDEGQICPWPESVLYPSLDRFGQ